MEKNDIEKLVGSLKNADGKIDGSSVLESVLSGAIGEGIQEEADFHEFTHTAFTSVMESLIRIEARLKAIERLMSIK